MKCGAYGRKFDDNGVLIDNERRYNLLPEQGLQKDEV